MSVNDMGSARYCFGRTSGRLSGWRVVDADRGAGIELELPGGHDLLACLRPEGDGDAVLAHLAGAARSGARRRATARRLAGLARRRGWPPRRRRLHDVDAVAVEAVGDGGARHGDDVGRRRRPAPRRWRTCPAAACAPDWASMPRTSSVRVSCATRASSDWISPLKTLPGIGVDGQLDRLADAQLADVLLGHREVDPDRIERLQRDQRHARRDVLALLDLADAEAAGERRERCAFWAMTAWMRLTAASRRVALGPRRIEVGLRGRRASASGRPGARRRPRPPAAMACGAGEVGLLHGDVELHELGARPAHPCRFRISTSVTMPATWEATSTPCEAISVPMEGSRSTHCSVRAGSAVTVAGGGFICDRNCGSSAA